MTFTQTPTRCKINYIQGCDNPGKPHNLIDTALNYVGTDKHRPTRSSDGQQAFRSLFGANRSKYLSAFKNNRDFIHPPSTAHMSSYNFVSTDIYPTRDGAIRESVSERFYISLNTSTERLT